MQDILKKIDQLKAEYDALLPMKPKDEQRLWEKLRLEWNYNSNHIEGNTMTYGETQLLFRLGDDFRAQNNSLKDVNEMRAHDVAVEMVKNWSQEGRPLLEADIRSLNKTLLVKEYWSEAVTKDGNPTRRLIQPGEYKEQPNHVVLANGNVFQYAEPVDVPAKMKELLDWYNDESIDLHPVVKAAYFHYKFVTIHPFDDGNGRVSRLLMNYELLKAGFPPVVIKSEDKQNYFYALQQADVGELDVFVEYIGEQVVWSLNLALTAGKGGSIVENGDFSKELNIIAKKAKQQADTKDYYNWNKAKFVSNNILEDIEEYILPFDSLFAIDVNIISKIENPLDNLGIYTESDSDSYKNYSNDLLEFVLDSKLNEKRVDAIQIEILISDASVPRLIELEKEASFKYFVLFEEDSIKYFFKPTTFINDIPETAKRIETLKINEKNSFIKDHAIQLKEKIKTIIGE